MSENKYFAFLRDIDTYFDKQLKNHAFADDYTYDNLKGTEFEEETVRAHYFYIHNKP